MATGRGVAAGWGEEMGNKLGLVFELGWAEARNCIIYVSSSNVEGAWCVLCVVSGFSNLQAWCNDLT